MSAILQKVPCGCKAILNPKDPRAEIWRFSLGCLEFPLKHPLPHVGKAENESPDNYLEGDWDALSLDQKARMKGKMKELFHISAYDFDEQIRLLGYMPIKDVNISVIFCQLHSRMMMSP